MHRFVLPDMIKSAVLQGYELKDFTENASQEQ
jgi:hypothetical protein